MIDAFSYLSVLLSIILGLAITQVLTGYRALLLRRQRVRLGAATLIWSVLLLLFATQAWWASFGLRSHSEWSFLAFSVVLLQMALVYMMAALVFPDIADGRVDLDVHFLAHRQAFFGFLLAILGVSILKDFVLSGSLPILSNLLFHGLLATIALAGLFLNTARAQLWLGVVTLVGFGAYVALLFARL